MTVNAAAKIIVASFRFFFIIYLLFYLLDETAKLYVSKIFGTVDLTRTVS